MHHGQDHLRQTHASVFSQRHGLHVRVTHPITYDSNPNHITPVQVGRELKLLDGPTPKFMRIHWIHQDTEDAKNPDDS